MSLKDRVLSNLEKRRQKVIDGGINSIPTPFTRFSEDFIGVEQGKFYCVTAPTKVGKTTFASYLFIYNSIFYAYNNPDKISLKIFYYPLEETPEDILERFMCYLLYKVSKGTIIVDRTALKSSNNTPISQDILDTLNNGEYKNILDFFEKTVIFSSSSNATGVWKEMVRYAEDNGTIYKKKVQIKDELGIDKEIEIFDHYEQKDPLEFKLIFYDHLGLISTERGFTLKQSMDKLGEYFVKLRNMFNFSICCVQQQNTNTESLDAFKLGKDKSSIQNLADSSYTSRNCDICIGVNSPYRSEKRDWHGYNIAFYKDYFRYIEILINRQGSSGGVLPLFYLGKVCEWREMPLLNDTVNISRVQQYINSLRGTNVLMFTFNKQFINRLGGKKIKNYLCSLFKKKEINNN